MTRLAQAYHTVFGICVLEHNAGHLTGLTHQVVVLELEAAVFGGTHGGLAFAGQRDNRVYAHQVIRYLLVVVRIKVLGEVTGLSVHGLVGGRGEVGYHEGEIALSVQNGHAFAQEQVRIEQDGEVVLAGRDTRHIYPLAVKTGVVVVAPAY